MDREKIFVKIFSVFISVFWVLFAVGAAAYFILKRFVYPVNYGSLVVEAANEYHLEADLIFAVIQVESKFRPLAESPKGAKGLMQITDSTADFIAGRLGIDRYDIFDEKTNINFGSYYLNYLLNRFKDTGVAVAAYNAGETNVANWLKDPLYSNDGETLVNIPFPETESYVDRVAATRKAYAIYHKYDILKLQAKYLKTLSEELILTPFPSMLKNL